MLAFTTVTRLFAPLLRVQWLAPLATGVLFLLAWQGAVVLFQWPPYLLPGPLLVFQTLLQDWGLLWPALVTTLQITLLAFGLAALSGLALAMVFSQSVWLERSLFPYAIILQTTPIVAIAPLIIIWVRKLVPGESATFVSLVICAWIVALFPILSNTVLGLKSVDRVLLNLFQLYNASRWQTLIHLQLPYALPYFLGGLRISGGLALIGAVVAEFVAGTGGTRSGLAYEILMASYNLQIPRMFAALFLVSALGVLLFTALTALSYVLLHRWHDSALSR